MLLLGGLAVRNKKGPPVLSERGAFGLGAWQCPTFAWGSTLSSALGGFTSEVGMGSGGSRPPWPPGNSVWRPRLWAGLPVSGSVGARGECRVVAPSSPAPRPAQAAWALYGQASRAISTGQLRALPRFHTRPINLVVCKGPSGDSWSRGGLILGGASRLDAFSGYPVRT